MEFGVKFNKQQESILRKKNIDFIRKYAGAWGVSIYVPGKIVKSTGLQKTRTKDELIAAIKKEVERRLAFAPLSSGAKWVPSDLDDADISEESPYDINDAMTGVSLDEGLSLSGMQLFGKKGRRKITINFK
jgi:hypothetical protein